MHLHWLKIKNIASLFGDHIIDFDELTSQDLFAITGETGAGKSSILNAISLALYGNVYKKQLNQADLVSLGEREASVDIQFSTKTKKYQASWTAQVKKKDGTPLQPPRMNKFFYEVKGDELHLLDKKQKPEDVLSLDFDQFCKCVILNQGDFAKFLISNFSERRDILEKLYPSDNLEIVGGIARRRHLEAQEELGRLEIQIHTLQGEAVFDIETIKLERNKLHQEIELLQVELNHLRPGIQIFETLKEQSLKYAQTLVKKNEAEKAQADRTSLFNEALNKMTQFKTSYDHFQESFDRNFEKFTQDEKIRQELLREKERLEKSSQEIKQLTSKQVKNQLKLDGLSIEISRIKDELKEFKLHRPHFVNHSKLDWKLVDRLLFELPVLRDNKTRSDNELKDLMLKGKTLSQSLEQLKREKELVLHHQFSFSERTLRLEELKEKKSRQNANQERASTLNKKKIDLASQLPQLKQRLEELRLLKDSQHLQHLVTTMLQHLKDHPQEDCPLCTQAFPKEFSGSLINMNPVNSETDYVTLFNTQEHKVTQLETQHESIEHEIQSLPPIDPKLDDIITELEVAHQALTDIEKRYEFLETQLTEARENYKTKKEKSEQIAQESKLLEEYFIDCTSLLKTQTFETLKELETIKMDLGIKKIKHEKEQTLNAFESQNIQLAEEMTQEKEFLDLKVEDLSKYQSKFQKEWSTFQLSYPNGDSPEARLKKLRDDLKQMQLQEQMIQIDLRQKEREHSDARSHTQRILDQIKQIELLFSEERNKLSHSFNLDISIDEASKILDPFIEERRLQISQREKSLQEITTKVGFLTKQIEDEKERSQKLNHFKLLMEKSKSETHRWKRVLDVLGQDDMRTFVLSLVELALIKQTNYELSKLIHGRYEILQNQKRGKLTPEFLVIDHWSDGQVRKVSTLSGGETFMVSLAMALALAEMARGRADIDSFFIDEGFGTLDEDSLEDVVGMLQQVRSRGKQIGLITHVKNLSERLPVNLRVIKNDRGHSHTQVLYN